MKTRAPVLSAILSLAAFLALLIATNAIVGMFTLRLDLTEDRAFTLSEGTRRILSEIEMPVQARLYFGTSEGTFPPFLKNYARRVQDLVGEMAQASGGRLQVKVLDPVPDSEAEDSARLDGIEPQLLPNGESITMGISITSLDRKAVIPFLAPDRERLLEYDIARAISEVERERKPVLGILSALPVLGQQMPMMMMGGQGPVTWVLADELRRDFDVREVPIVAEDIPPEIEVLFVIHPKGINEATEFAIDQFLMRGGRLVAFLDPFCLFDGGFAPMPQPSSSTLPTLLPAWGLGFDDTQAVVDLNYEGRTREGRAPWLLELNQTALNREDPLTADTDSLVMAFAGAYSVNATDSLRVETLAHTSDNSQLVEPFAARMSPESVIRNFTPSGMRMPLALRLTGKFRTAFPEGRPAPEGGEKPVGDSLKESTTETSVILVGDVDMIQDPLSVTEVRGLFAGQRMMVPVNGNLGFAQSAAEQLSGNPALIAVRGRAVASRPFTVVREMQARAEQKFQATIRELEASLEETQNRLAELERGKQDGQKFILSPDQQREIEKFRTTEAEVRQRLKATRRDLRAEIDALEVRLKWLNIAAVPIVVAVVGIGFGLWRRSRSRAK